jgi:preprotein translocase subunit SecF
MNLYDVTNLSINQTLSRTVITSGLVFLSVVAMVLLGGETLRPFSLALLMGIIFGTYDTIAVAGPIMVWWEKKIAAANKATATNARDTTLKSARGAARGERSRDGVGKPSQAA